MAVSRCLTASERSFLASASSIRRSATSASAVTASALRMDASSAVTETV